MPAEGVDRKTFMRARFGDAAANTGTPARIAAEAEGLGIALDYDAIGRVPNTFNGHRLVEWIGPGEAQHALMETLFSYYFCEGRDLGDIEVLADAAVRVGVDRERALAMLRSDVGVDDLRARVREAYDAGVTGVPCFVLPSGFGIPGAQPPEVLARIIEKAREQLAEQPTT